MVKREYIEPVPIEMEDALLIFNSKDPVDICNALIGLTYHHPDWKSIQDQCEILSSHDSIEVRSLTATCFGHIARIHGQLEINKVIPILEKLKEETEIEGIVEDAISDIQIFAPHLLTGTKYAL